MKHILLTGNPGVGKTTMVQKLIVRLTELNLPVDGFITEEIRHDGQRNGFNVRLISSDETAVLADKNRANMPDTRKYGVYTVYVKKFEDFVLPPLLTFENGILVIDEIGKMELFSKKFENAVATLFKKENVLIIATVPLRSHPFVDGLKRSENCHLFAVNRGNREEMLAEILKLLKSTPFTK